MLYSLDRGQYRRSTRSDDNVPGAVPQTVYLDLTRADESRPAFDQSDAGTLEMTFVIALETGDGIVATRNQLGPIEPRAVPTVLDPTVTDRIARSVPVLGRVHHQLLRYAPANDAGASDAVGFCDRHTRTV
jgi:hypothetical protein